MGEIKIIMSVGISTNIIPIIINAFFHLFFECAGVPFTLVSLNFMSYFRGYKSPAFLMEVHYITMVNSYTIPIFAIRDLLPLL